MAFLISFAKAKSFSLYSGNGHSKRTAASLWFNPLNVAAFAKIASNNSRFSLFSSA